MDAKSKAEIARETYRGQPALKCCGTCDYSHHCDGYLWCESIEGQTDAAGICDCYEDD